MKNERILYYVNRFKEVYDGKPWYGENFVTKLKDVTQELAFNQYGSLHTIASLVSHMAYWRKPLVSRLEGDTSFKASMKSEENWMPLDKLRTIGWLDIRAAFNTTQEKIITLLPSQTDAFLSEKFSGDYTMVNLIQGVIDHDIYHLGQIGIVKAYGLNAVSP